MSEAFIHTENLSFSYMDEDGKPESPALRGISVDIQQGEYVAVLGHNGSGKSTFAKLLNLILEPTGGKLVIDGVDLTDHELSDEEVLATRLPALSNASTRVSLLYALARDNSTHPSPSARKE